MQRHLIKFVAYREMLQTATGCLTSAPKKKKKDLLQMDFQYIHEQKWVTETRSFLLHLQLFIFYDSFPPPNILLFSKLTLQHLGFIY